MNNNKNKTFRMVDFAVPVDHRVKLKESEKKDKYLDFAKKKKSKKKKLWNMKVTVIPIVICPLVIIPKKLEKALKS